MSVNKNALIRYKVMDSCFRNHAKKYFIEDLIDDCSKVLAELNSSTNGISRRQIFQDILFMESSEGWSGENAHIDPPVALQTDHPKLLFF